MAMNITECYNFILGLLLVQIPSTTYFFSYKEIRLDVNLKAKVRLFVLGQLTESPIVHVLQITLASNFPKTSIRHAIMYG